MKDFTKKGTKLPVIPVGTEYSIPNIFPEICKFKKKNQNYESRKDFISYGAFNETWIKAEVKNYSSDDYYLFKLSTIERLAKEQGMWDDGITITFKDKLPPFFNGCDIRIYSGGEKSKSFSNPSNLEYAMNKSRAIFGEWLDKKITNIQSNINEMNPKVTLQKSGDIKISPNPQMNYIIDKVTVDEICRLVKEDKPKLEVGKWYKSETYPNALYFITKIEDNNFYAYGFNGNGNWEYECEWCDNLKKEIKDQKPYEASPETVQQYLIEEAVKRGYEKGTKYKHIKYDTVEFLKQPKNLKLNIEYNNLTDGCGGSIFDEGVWATIIKPETITRAEAEKQLGKVITD